MGRTRNNLLAAMAALACWLVAAAWPGGEARAATVTCPSAALGEALNIVTTSGVTTCTNIGTAKATTGIEIYNSLVAGCLAGGCAVAGTRFGVSFRRINSGSNEQPTLAACTGGCTSLVGTNAPVDADSLFGESSSGVVRDWELGIGVTTMVGCLTNSDSCSITFQFADGTAGTFLVPQGSTTIPSFSFGGEVLLPPTITSVSPSSGPVSGGTEVTILGTNFTNVTRVVFAGSADAASFSVISSTEIRAVTPDIGGAAPRRMLVVNDAGTAVGDYFTFVPSLAVPNQTLPKATLGSAYAATLVANSNLSFAATGLPPGLGLNAATGVISGIPSAAGVFNVTVSVIQDASNAVGGPFTSPPKQLSLVVSETVVSVQTPSLPSGIYGSPFSATLTATGGTGPYTYSAGGLPSGLSIVGDKITGTPSQTGKFPIILTATDGTSAASGGPYQSGLAYLTLVIEKAPQFVRFEVAPQFRTVR